MAIMLPQPASAGATSSAAASAPRGPGAGLARVNVREKLARTHMTVMMTVIIKKSAKMPVMTVMTEESIWLT
jgi:hypothetical protein